MWNIRFKCTDLIQWEVPRCCVSLLHCYEPHSRTFRCLRHAHLWSAEHLSARGCTYERKQRQEETNTVRPGKWTIKCCHLKSLSIRLWCGLLQPLVLGVHRTAVFLPADERLWQTVDLALESCHAGLLSVNWLRLFMEVCHGCRERESGILIRKHHNSKPGSLQGSTISARTHSFTRCKFYRPRKYYI